MRCRPILLPIIVSTDNKYIANAIQNIALLQQLAIKVAEKPTGLVVTAIPSLLAHVNVNDFMQSILASLASGQADKAQLAEVLQQYILPLPIANIAQAEQLIEQLNMLAITKKWCISLDQPMLSSLFLTS